MLGEADDELGKRNTTEHFEYLKEHVTRSVCACLEDVPKAFTLPLLNALSTIGLVAAAISIYKCILI